MPDAVAILDEEAFEVLEEFVVEASARDVGELQLLKESIQTAFGFLLL